MAAGKKGSPEGRGPAHHITTPYKGIPRTPWLGGTVTNWPGNHNPAGDPEGALTITCLATGWGQESRAPSSEGSKGALWTGHTPRSRTPLCHSASEWPGPQGAGLRGENQHW